MGVRYALHIIDLDYFDRKRKELGVGELGERSVAPLGAPRLAGRVQSSLGCFETRSEPTRARGYTPFPEGMLSLLRAVL